VGVARVSRDKKVVKMLKGALNKGFRRSKKWRQMSFFVIFGVKIGLKMAKCLSASSRYDNKDF